METATGAIAAACISGFVAIAVAIIAAVASRGEPRHLRELKGLNEVMRDFAPGSPEHQRLERRRRNVLIKATRLQLGRDLPMSAWMVGVSAPIMGVGQILTPLLETVGLGYVGYALVLSGFIFILIAIAAFIVEIRLSWEDRRARAKIPQDDGLS